jgi:flagellar M-ring protein FliF
LYDIDTKPGFNKEKVITATASIKPVGTSQLDEARVSSIRHLVAGTIACLKPENVTVCDLNGRTWHGNLNESGAEGNLYISQQRIYEQNLKAKILNALCYIPNVTVETSVELARVKQPQHIANAPKNANSINKNGRNNPSAAASLQPNTATVLKALLGSGDAESNAPADAPVASEQFEKEDVGLTPTLAKVSVGVPTSYFQKIWQERNPLQVGRTTNAPDPAALDQIRIEESAKIQRHVGQLLPSVENAAKAAELVTVTTFQDIPIQEPPAPDYREHLWNWLHQSWGTLGTVALALISLLVLRSMVRGASTANARTIMQDNHDDDLAELKSATVPPPHAQGFYKTSGHAAYSVSGHPERSEGSRQARSQNHYNTNPSLNDELSEMVADDPDAAANVLRSWIGRAG